MNEEKDTVSQREEQHQLLAKVRLPGFITDEDIGLGDVIKRTTSAIGIRPCGSCERRAAILNQWLIFSGKHSK